MKKKNIALAFGITSNYIDILANALIGLVKHSTAFWDGIVVFHNGISKENQKKINNITKCNFIEVKEQDFVKYISQDLIKLYSVATFFKFESYKLLDEYHKVIWSDVDVLFQKDISELAKYADKTGYAATIATPNYRNIDNFCEIINKYNMFVPMYNAGLFVISDKLKNYKKIYDWCYYATKKYSTVLKWLDQAVQNIMIQEFKIDVEEIDLEKYHCHPSNFNFSNDAFIIHAHGTRKFWNDNEYKTLYSEWQENNAEWKKINSHKISNSKLIKVDKPIVSVIMSIYERYTFVDEAINSILAQTFNDFEFLICVEKTKKQKEIASYLKKFNDKRIKILLNQETLGFPESLNIMINNSKGKYIARMDDDDVSLPNRLERQVMFLESNKDIGICGTNAEFFMYAQGKWFNKNLSSEEIKTQMLFTNPICHPSVLMRKDLLDKFKIRYEKEYFSEDYQIWSRSIKFFKIANINEVLLRYRASNTNLTTYGINENKIHNSVKATMYYQFKNYLNLELNDNELELIQKRKQVIYPGDWYKSARKLQKNLYKRIMIANKTTKFYNNYLLKREFKYLLNNENKNIIDYFIKVVKKIFRVFYKKLEYRIDSKIENSIGNIMYKTNVIEKKIKELNDKIEEVSKK